MKNPTNKPLKRLIKRVLLFMLIIIQSCQTENELPHLKDRNENFILKEKPINEFKNILIASTHTLEKSIESKKLKGTYDRGLLLKNSSPETIKQIENVNNELVNNAKDLLNELGYGEDEIRQDFKDLNDPRIILAGLMILSIKYQYELEKFSIPLSNEASRNGKIRNCFLESTGIAAGVALVSALVAQTTDKKLVKKLIKKAMKKIGARTLGGIGVALIVADFTYCMLSENYTVVNKKATCNELVKINLVKSNNFVLSNDYYLLKKDINYNSNEDFEINPDKKYNVYMLTIDKTKCETSAKYAYQIIGKEFDKSSISDFSIRQQF